MNRREFIAGLGSTAWPVAAHAQQRAMPVIGFLSALSPEAQDEILARFRQGLKEAGYVEERNVAIEFRWADAQYDRLPAMAVDLVRRQVAVICAGGEPAAGAAKAATGTIPIVFLVGDDAVKLGLVASLNRPGGNATGLNLLLDEVESKRLELLHQLVPKAAVIAVLLNPKYPGFKTELADLRTAARALGRQIILLEASNETEIDAAFATMVQQRVGGLQVGSDPFSSVRRQQIVALAARHAIPAIYWSRRFMEAGGLIGYFINTAEAYHQAGNYVGRILKGERPADLPVIRSTRFYLIINLKTAKALGLTIPPNLLAIADEVIE
jgi:putative tryptophan/tyrosine transport system substrate-binding protein